MPSRNHAPSWVIGLRNQLATTIGPAYRVTEQRGKAKLYVRFSNGSRATSVLPFKWVPAQAGAIQRAVEEIAQTMATGRAFKDAIKILNGTIGNNSLVPNPLPGGAAEQLLMIWERFGEYKVRRTGEIKASTWAKDYGQTGKRLSAITNAVDAKALLSLAGEAWEPGSRRRQICCQHLSAMLRWGCEQKLLEVERWNPPSNIKAYVGERISPTEEAIPLDDNQILKLLKDLPVDEAGKRWRYCLQLICAFGLRPVEVMHLQLKPNDQLWCNYCKRSGGGTTRPRQLRALHPEWAEEWKLLERFASKEELPPFGGGVADAARRYLIRQKSWKPITEIGATVYAFRHGYALRAHQDYGLSIRVASKLMGHSTETHLRIYGSWADADTIDCAIEAGIRYRAMTKADPIPHL